MTTQQKLATYKNLRRKGWTASAAFEYANWSARNFAALVASL